MSKSPLRRTTLVLLLVGLLTASLASAAVRQAAPKTAAPSAIEILARTWSFLTRLWSETGCDVDPDGRCVNNSVRPVPPQGREGCTGDPNGRCVNTPHLDTGCNGDPNGRCTP